MAAGYPVTMRWHVELNDTGSPLRVEHVEDVDIARDTAVELAQTTHGGRKGVREQNISAVIGQLNDEDFADAEPGQAWTYDVADGMGVIVAALDDADTDDDCWRCREETTT